MAVLLIALLPWGAHLRAMPTHGDDGASGQEAELSSEGSETAHPPAIKCRKGLPAYPCSPDTKALAFVSVNDEPEARHLPTARRDDRLPTGLAAPPALPPPRFA